jgi:hypothetical protein
MPPPDDRHKRQNRRNLIASEEDAFAKQAAFVGTATPASAPAASACSCFDELS